MSEPSSIWKARGRVGDSKSCVMPLVTAVVVCGFAVLPFSLWIEGLKGGLALGSAILICLASGLAGLGIASLPTPRHDAVYGLLFAMVFRLFPPLAVCLLLAIESSGAEYLGFVCYLLLFYMITLSVETYLSIKRIQSQAY